MFSIIYWPSIKERIQSIVSNRALFRASKYYYLPKPKIENTEMDQLSETVESRDDTEELNRYAKEFHEENNFSSEPYRLNLLDDGVTYLLDNYTQTSDLNIGKADSDNETPYHTGNRSLLVNYDSSNGSDSNDSKYFEKVSKYRNEAKKVLDEQKKITKTFVRADKIKPIIFENKEKDSIKNRSFPVKKVILKEPGKSESESDLSRDFIKFENSSKESKKYNSEVSFTKNRIKKRYSSPVRKVTDFDEKLEKYNSSPEPLKERRTDEFKYGSDVSAKKYHMSNDKISDKKQDIKEKERIDSDSSSPKKMETSEPVLHKTNIIFELDTSNQQSPYKNKIVYDSNDSDTSVTKSRSPKITRALIHKNGDSDVASPKSKDSKKVPSTVLRDEEISCNERTLEKRFSRIQLSNNYCDVTLPKPDGGVIGYDTTDKLSKTRLNDDKKSYKSQHDVDEIKDFIDFDNDKPKSPKKKSTKNKLPIKITKINRNYGKESQIIILNINPCKCKNLKIRRKMKNNQNEQKEEHDTQEEKNNFESPEKLKKVHILDLPNLCCNYTKDINSNFENRKSGPTHPASANNQLYKNSFITEENSKFSLQNLRPNNPFSNATLPRPKSKLKIEWFPDKTLDLYQCESNENKIESTSETLLISESKESLQTEISSKVDSTRSKVAELKSSKSKVNFGWTLNKKSSTHIPKADIKERMAKIGWTYGDKTSPITTEIKTKNEVQKSSSKEIINETSPGRYQVNFDEEFKNTKKPTFLANLKKLGQKCCRRKVAGKSSSDENVSSAVKYNKLFKKRSTSI